MSKASFLTLIGFLYVSSASLCAAEVHDRPKDGQITLGPGDYTIDLTDKQGKSLGQVTSGFTVRDGMLIPQDRFPTTASCAAVQCKFSIPKTVYKLTDTSKNNPINVIDIDQRSTRRQSPLVTPQVSNPISDLMIESLFFDKNSGEYILQNIFGTEADLIGVGTLVNIPDLYAGDILYSLVDLDVYLLSVPTLF